MAKRPTLTDLTSLTNSSAINTLSQNWDAIQEAFDNTLSLDGSTPNAMEADFDLNGNALLNVGTIDVENLTLNGQTVTDLASVPEWKGAWVAATAYAKNDLVKTNGNVYICLVAHTSGTFATDLTALKWELMVSKGDSGAGTGDLVSTNNLSDVSNVATARSNLGLGTVATENTVPLSKGGTGATDAVTARTNLGLGALATQASVTTSQIAAATLVTEADTIASNDNDTTIPTSAAVKALFDTVGAGVLLATKTASASSTLNFTEFNNATYSRYVFVLENVKPTTDAVYLMMRFSTDAGSTYDSSASAYDWTVNGWNSSNSNIQGGQSDTFISLTSQSAVAGAQIGNAATEFGVTGEITLYSAASTTVRSRIITDLAYDNAAGNIVSVHGTGRRNAAQDTDAVRFLFSSGTIASGTIKMYGII